MPNSNNTSSSSNDHISSFSEYDSSVGQAHLLPVKFDLCMEKHLTNQSKENHAKRLTNMRKEIDFINSTEWMYEPIEKYIGQIQKTKSVKL